MSGVFVMPKTITRKLLNLRKNTELNSKSIKGIYTCKVSDNFGATATNVYARGSFSIISQFGTGAEIDGSGLKITENSNVICIGYAQFGQGISAGDYMHCIVGENFNGGSTPNQTWHGQIVANGPWDSCMISPNMRQLSSGTIIYPWVKCEQGFSNNYLAGYSTFTFIII